MCLFVFQLAVASHCYSLLPSEGQWCVCLSSNWQWQVISLLPSVFDLLRCDQAPDSQSVMVDPGLARMLDYYIALTQSYHVTVQLGLLYVLH